MFFLYLLVLDLKRITSVILSSYGINELLKKVTLIRAQRLVDIKDPHENKKNELT